MLAHLVFPGHPFGTHRLSKACDSYSVGLKSTYSDSREKLEVLIDVFIYDFIDLEKLAF
ncbi:hypothetical protein T07_98 [Trichinella nelsoni]|uniref:Uncharacterized protein n=1 Tax=Trichinella nelsoni TaxID=6336 RepID=A0A0V0RAU7_9BILA|nr:hypothetical protein T07_98 [Trichinella nelsoni]